jgi:hypothetical protein
MLDHVFRVIGLCGAVLAPLHRPHGNAQNIEVARDYTI